MFSAASHPLPLTQLPPPPSTPAAAAAAAAAKITRGHSCILCFQRKVRCDGRRPCAACTKAGVACVSKAPSAAPRRRKPAQLAREELLARLRRCEELLESCGVRVEDEVASTTTTPTTPSHPRPGWYESSTLDVGRLIIERGDSRYIENDLWSELGDELKDSSEMRQTPSNDSYEERSATPPAIFASGDNLLFDHAMVDLRSSHPEPVQMFMLWQTFLDNVNPLVKLLHAPTVQQSILEASGDLDNVSASTEALMFAIYLCAVTSLESGDCERVMGEGTSRPALLYRFSIAAQQALSNAEILKTSNLVVLQAFTLFLLAMREHREPYSIWLLSGLALRIGQRIGLHRESATREVSVFEAEMRRRLWWQILTLDFRSAQLSGVKVEISHRMFETKRPLNVNDSDLSPSMKEPPLEHSGVTDMIFCSIRYEVGEFMRNTRIRMSDGFSEGWNSVTSLAEKDKAIDDLEKLLEQKYLKYTDQSIPLHLLAVAVARGAAYQMRLIAHHPRQYPDKGASLPRAEKDMLFSTSLKMVEYNNLGRAAQSLRGYLWHMNVYLQLEAFIYLLGELRYRVQGHEVDHAWEEVRQMFENHPKMITDVKNSLYFALGNLALKAWNRRAAALALSRGVSRVAAPDFIAALRSCRKGKPVGPSNASAIATTMASDAAAAAAAAANGDAYMNPPGQFDDLRGLDIAADFDPAAMPLYPLSDSSPMDWEYWQALLDGDALPMLDDDRAF